MQFEGKNLIVQGKYLRIASLEKEFYENLMDPEEAARVLKGSELRVDLFTFIQKFPDIEPRHKCFREKDNFAVIRITDYESWFKNSLPKQTRKGIKKSRTRGIEIRQVEFNRDLVKGIKEIFDDQPTRQGKPFWHYNKTLEEVEEVMGRDLEQSLFFGAFFEGNLVGFIKMLLGDGWARTVTVASKGAYNDKYPMPALFSACVEYCIDQKIPFIVYGRFEYGKVGSPTLTDFKKHVGFQKMEIPRYFIPLTFRGKMALTFKVHHGIVEVLPRWFVQKVLQLRRSFYDRKKVS